MSKVKSRAATANPALEPGRTHIVVIRGWRPATINQIYDRHWWVGAKLKKRDRKEVAGALTPSQLIDPERPIKRRVSIEIAYGKIDGKRLRECDGDAFWKSTLDALVAAGALKDDKPTWCKAGEAVQIKSTTDETTTTITLEDL